MCLEENYSAPALTAFSQSPALAHRHIYMQAQEPKKHTHTLVITRANGENTALYSDARDVGLLQSDVRTGAMPTCAHGS